MEFLRVVKDLQSNLLNVGYVSEFQIIKDETSAFPKLRDNIRDYIGYIVPVKFSLSTSGNDKIELLFGVSGISTSDDEDYLQVVAKCIAAIKQTFVGMAYIKDDDISNMDIVIDSEEREDNVIVYCYTSLIVDIKLSYGNKI